MITRRLKFVSAVFGAAALLATVAVAHTVRSHATLADERATIGRAIDAAPEQTAPFQGHGNFACGLPSQAACNNVETWFPE